MNSAATSIRPGDRIAEKYVVDRVLGRGGMGIVVAARHVDLDRLFALKLILPEALANPTASERLMREARASARLQSEHVVRVSDVGRMADGSAYLVMEYLDGLDLQQVLDQRGPLPPAEAIHYMAQACAGVAEAHGAGIVHRDLKPANLFLTRRPDGSACVKVLDFGIAKDDGGFAAMSMTATGAVMGSPIYMAPEVVRAARNASPASDVWGLGVTLYELVTGAIPYQVESVTELIAAIMTERPIPPAARGAMLPPPLEQIIMRCLERDPAARFRTARELELALTALGRQPVAWGTTASQGGQSARGPELPMHGVGAQTAGPTSSSIGKRPPRGAAPIVAAVAMGVTLVGMLALAALRPWEAPAGSAQSAVSPSVAAAEPPGAAPLPAPEPTAVPASTAPVASSAPAAGSAAPAPAPSVGPAPPPGTSAGSGRAAPAKTSTPPKKPSSPPAKQPPAPGWGGLL